MAGEPAGWEGLLSFFVMKSFAVLLVGWVSLLLEQADGPPASCAWSWLSANLVCQLGFNLALNWGILAVSPLAARLFILLGLPLSLVVELVTGSSLQLGQVVGVSLVVSGVAGFETFSKKAPQVPQNNVDVEEEQEFCVTQASADLASVPPRPLWSRPRLAVAAVAGLFSAGLLAVALWIWAVLQHRKPSLAQCGGTYEVPGPLDSPWPLAGLVASAQRLFDQGLLLSAGFNHDEALRSFHAASAMAPDEPFLHWAVAYALAGNLNRPLDASRLQAAQEAVQQMKLSASSGRQLNPEELALLEAMAKRFPASRSVLPGQWVSSYDVAYFEVLRARQAELGAPSTWFLALLGQAAMETDPWNYFINGSRTQLTAIAAEALLALRAALVATPRQPLALHYMVHLLESQRPLSEEALFAGATLDVAFHSAGPGHLTHMPSHAYFSVGRYHDASQANFRAIAVDKAYFAACENANVSGYNAYYQRLYFCHKHAVLINSLEMEGRLSEALAIIGDLEAKCHIDEVGMNMGGVFATYGHEAERHLAWVRFGKWADILEFGLRNDTSAPSFVRAVRHFAIAMAMASFNPPRQCDEAFQQRRYFEAALSEAASQHIFRVERLGKVTVSVTAGEVLNLANLTLAARLAKNCGTAESELELWSRASAAATDLPYFEPPFWRLDPVLCLGELLLASGNVSSARQSFEDHLARFPESAWGLLGLRRAAEAAGNQSSADSLQRRFSAAWQHADSELGSSCF